MKGNRITIRISEEMEEELKDIATAEDRSVSNVIRRMINEYIDAGRTKRTATL